MANVTTTALSLQFYKLHCIIYIITAIPVRACSIYILTIRLSTEKYTHFKQRCQYFRHLIYIDGSHGKLRLICTSIIYYRYTHEVGFLWFLSKTSNILFDVKSDCFIVILKYNLNTTINRCIVFIVYSTILHAIPIPKCTKFDLFQKYSLKLFNNLFLHMKNK